MYLDQPVAHILEIFNASGKGGCWPPCTMQR